MVPCIIPCRTYNAALRSPCPLKCVPPSLQRLQGLFQWYCTEVSWLTEEWDSIIFNIESCFSVDADDRRIHFWSRPGYRSRATFALQRHTAIIILVLEKRKNL